MIHHTHPTIRAFAKRYGHFGSRSIARHPQDDSTFRRLVQSVYAQGNRSTHRGAQGLTIQDYWRRAVAGQSHCARFGTHRQTPSESAPPEPPAPTDQKPAAAVTAVKGCQLSEATAAAHQDPTGQHAIDQAVAAASQRHGLPAALIRSVIQHESNFNPRAVSPAGALGLMQLMPGTASELGVQNPFDISQNVDGGSRYLRKMLDRFGGDLRKALAAYNAGPGTVRRYDGVPPYPETHSYIRRVLASAGESVSDGTSSSRRT